MFELQDVQAVAAAEGAESPPPPATSERIDGLPTSEAPSGRLTFVRRKDGKIKYKGVGRGQTRSAYKPERRVRLHNSMLLSVGFLELANAGDFAANVFNYNPLPPYAIALMALGGTIALTMIYFTVKDAMLSLKNLRGLREERRFLKSQQEKFIRDRQMSRTIACYLDVNFREMGTEIVDRCCMDVLLGGGALLVGAGTYLAIDSGNPNTYFASNILTGYIGNSPCALYGVTNLLWSVWVWRRATRHKKAALPHIQDRRIKELLKMRASSVQFHGALNGISGIVAGVAALITATQWWGYVVLAPCLITSILINYFWRHRVGYDRPFIHDLVPVDDESFLDWLTYIDNSHRRLVSATEEPLSVLVTDPSSLSSVMEFITDNQLFEYFCLRVLSDPDLIAKLFPGDDTRITISWRQFTAVTDEALNAKLLAVASDLVRHEAPVCFRHQERYLLETLGCYLYLGERRKETQARGLPFRRNSNPQYRNVHTDSGRHTNDWLFGGFSITQLVREAFVT